MFYENDKAISNLSGRISLRTAANAALFELQFKGEERLTEAEAGCGHVEQCPLSEPKLTSGRLATDVKKRELFKKLAVDLRVMAHDIQSMIGARRFAVRVYVVSQLPTQPALIDDKMGSDWEMSQSAPNTVGG